MHASPEINLVLACASPHRLSNDRYLEVEQTLKRAPDWETIIDRSIRLGVSLLVYRRLAEQFPNKIPDTALKQFKRIHIHNTARSMIQSKTLLTVLKLFKANHIMAIPFKGPVMSSYLYGNDAVRFFGDLDIFILPKDILAAKNLLLNAGYQTANHIPQQLEKHFFKIDHALNFFHPKTKINLDLQWKLFRIYSISSITLEKLRHRIKEINFLEKKVLSLGDDDLFFFLCAHGAKHHWENLEFVTSISALMQKTAIDWEYVLDLAQKEGCKRMMLMGAHLANTIFCTPLDKRITAEIDKDTTIPELTQQVLDYYKFDLGLKSDFTQNIDLSFFQIKVRDSIKAKALFSIRALAKPSFKDFNMVNLPFIFYYLFKPTRLMLKLVMATLTKTMKRIRG